MKMMRDLNYFTINVMHFKITPKKAKEKKKVNLK